MAETFRIAGTAEEAAAWKTPDAAYLAGGTEINRLGSAVRADVLISVRKLDDLKGIASLDRKIVIGAGCTFQEVIESDLAPDYIKEACRFMGSRTKRNMATVGGNIALLRDDSYLLPTLIASGAVLLLMGADGSTCDKDLAEYVKERTAAEAGDPLADALILAVQVPERLSFIKANRQANTVESNARLTIALGEENGKWRAAAAIKHCGLFVLDDLASLLEEDPVMPEEALIAWANAKDLPIEDDKVYGGAAYRRYLLGVTFSRLLRDRAALLGEAGTKGGLS